MDDEDLRIVILGAGPIGLEAALYARYLGYPTQMVEQGSSCARSVVARGEQAVGEFGVLASRLGVSALRAQDANWQPPPAHEVLTGAEWQARYLGPLAESDLIADVLSTGLEVLAIDRRDTDDDVAFEIKLRRADATESTWEADIVLDTTGADAPNWYGDGRVDDELGFANPEADFYVLGAKAGAESVAAGLVQIRDLFAILGEREDLDVYATMPAIL